MAEDKSSKTPAAQRQQAAAKQTAEISIIRISGRDINGNTSVIDSLRQVKGISHNLAHAIATVAESKLGIDRNTEIGSLSEEKLAKLENAMKNPAELGVPSFMLNRQKDWETGKELHMIGTDLVVRVRQDIDAAVKAQTWVGFRHRYGQRVRGQRTRSTGRTGETVGVTKKKVLEAQKAAREAEKKPGAKEEEKK